MDSLTANGITLHYRDEGPRTGTVMVFVNSLGTDFRVWDPLIPHLPQDLRIIRYDKRGHGLSDCPESDWGMADHVNDLRALLDTLDIESAVICGLSVGGVITQAFAEQAHGRVQGIILCDTAAKIGTAAMWDQRIAAIRQGGIAALADPIMERWFTARFRADPVRVAPWRNMVSRTPEHGYIRTCQALADTDLTQAAKTLTLPCLVLVGEDDGSTPPEVVRHTARLIKGAAFHVLPGAAHIPCVEVPAEMGRLIGGFIAAHGLH